MTDDELTAVVAAARLVTARRECLHAGAAPAASPWAVAARLPSLGVDVEAVRALMCTASRWSMSGRFRE